MKEINGNEIRDVVMTNSSFTFIVEETAESFKTKYRVKKIDKSKWVVGEYLINQFEILGYFDELRVLELQKYSKFRYSDKGVALFQHLLNSIDSVPLFLKVYEEEEDSQNAITMPY